MSLTEATLAYIAAHAGDDVAHLALHPPKDPQVDMSAALRQIAGRQKAMEKLPEWAAIDEVLYPARVSLEQCSSSQTAEYKASLLEGTSFADFSGGFGVDTVAFAKKFAKGWYVEPQEELCELFRHNCKALDIHNVNTINGKMEDHLDDIDHVDMIYLDPSRRDVHGQRVVSLADCTPNLLEWKSALLERCNILMVKMSPMIDIYQTLRDLPETYAVHVVAVEGECKEVLFLLTRNTPIIGICRDAKFCVSTTDTNATDSIITDANATDTNITGANATGTAIIAVDIGHNRTDNSTCLYAMHRVSTTLETERTTPPQIATEIGTYLYEPNAAIMKAGIFNTLSQQYQIWKLAKSTNLFTSNDLREDFPGRVFRIESTHDFHPRKTAKELSDLRSASIAVRNFPMSAEELRKTLKIKDGNACYLFGCTLSDGRKVILQTTKQY